MRILSCLFVALVCFSFVSCSDDDPTFEKDQIVGGWTVARYEGWYNEGNGRVTEDPVEFEDGDWAFYFDASESGAEYNGWNTSFSWSLINGNQLFLDYSGEKDLYKILDATETSLVIELYEKNEDGEQYSKLTLKPFTFEM